MKMNPDERERKRIKKNKLKINKINDIKRQNKKHENTVKFFSEKNRLGMSSTIITLLGLCFIFVAHGVPVSFLSFFLITMLLE